MASFSDASVTLINAATCDGTHTAGCGRMPVKKPAGSGAFWVAVNAPAGTAYVSDFNDSNLAVISLAADRTPALRGDGQAAIAPSGG